VSERCYFACSAVVNNAERFFLWFSDDIDGIVLDDDRIVTFASLDALAAHCANWNLPLSENSTVCYDFDGIDSWIRSTTASSVDVNVLLNAWNIMDDFYNSFFGYTAIADDDLELHQKLSLASFTASMPGVMADENYDPKWTTSDLSRIAKILDERTSRFKAAL